MFNPYILVGILERIINILGDNCPDSVKTSLSLLEDLNSNPNRFLKWRILRNLTEVISELRNLTEPEIPDLNNIISILTAQIEEFNEWSNEHIELTEEEESIRKLLTSPKNSYKDWGLLRLGKSNENVKKKFVILLVRISKERENHIFTREKALNILALLDFNEFRSLIEEISKEDSDVGVFATNLLAFKGGIREHRLYKSLDKNFFESGKEKSLGCIPRREFSKTGSETILLGGKAVGKVIVRIVTERAFLVWKEAFEAEGFWRSKGFDYIPIEPILKKENGDLMVYKRKDGKYRVFTKVLGVNLLMLRNVYHGDDDAYGYTMVGIKRTEEAIKEGIRELGILHGHLHPQNFCVEDYNGKLRLYIIDFDQAISH